MTTLVGTHDKLKDHIAGLGHPESPSRLDAVMLGMRESTVFEQIKVFAPRAILPSEFEGVHQAEYVNFVQRFSAHGGQIDADTGVSSGSFDAAIIAAGSGLDAIDRLREGQGEAAFLAVRPPGHHASFSQAMGFCLFNNVAIAANALAKAGEKVFIFDFDAHHGNGTQNLFYECPDVLYASIHQRNLFPGTGYANEVGSGHGFGTTINIPIPQGSTISTYWQAIEQIVEPILDEFKPAWVIASAGFDAHKHDPLASLSLTSDDFAQLISWLFRTVPTGRRLAFLEGGYDLEALRMCSAAVIAAIEGEHLKLEPPSSGPALVSVVSDIADIRSRSMER